MYKLGAETRCFTAILVHLYKSTRRIADECTKLASGSITKVWRDTYDEPKPYCRAVCDRLTPIILPPFADGHLAARCYCQCYVPKSCDGGSERLIRLFWRLARHNRTIVGSEGRLRDRVRRFDAEKPLNGTRTGHPICGDAKLRDECEVLDTVAKTAMSHRTVPVVPEPEGPSPWLTAGPTWREASVLPMEARARSGRPLGRSGPRVREPPPAAPPAATRWR